jgi:hypothetical protein
MCSYLVFNNKKCKFFVFLCGIKNLFMGKNCPNQAKPQALCK